PILVLGHVLSPVRSLPRHSLLLIANYTSEHVCWLRPPAIFGNPLPFSLSSGFRVVCRRLVVYLSRMCSLYWAFQCICFSPTFPWCDIW
ncbi:hypothetical protein GY45DRAFT_1427862, partial [Cubamyces sp. BRFM 1775]